MDVKPSLSKPGRTLWRPGGKAPMFGIEIPSPKCEHSLALRMKDRGYLDFLRSFRLDSEDNNNFTFVEAGFCSSTAMGRVRFVFVFFCGVVLFCAISEYISDLH